jgi:hypothetical protein
VTALDGFEKNDKEPGAGDVRALPPKWYVANSRKLTAGSSGILEKTTYR